MIKFTVPSRPDAWPLKRDEKQHMMFLTNAVSVFADTIDNLTDRLSKIEGGTEAAQKLQDDSVKLLEMIRVTIPEKQRANLYNTCLDTKMTIVPKYTPGSGNVIVPQDDFKELTDFAKAKCGECALDSEECKQCKLYQLLTAILPLNRYVGPFLCPFNLAVWKEDEEDDV